MFISHKRWVFGKHNFWSVDKQLFFKCWSTRLFQCWSTQTIVYISTLCRGGLVNSVFINRCFYLLIYNAILYRHLQFPVHVFIWSKIWLFINASFGGVDQQSNLPLNIHMVGFFSCLKDKRNTVFIYIHHKALINAEKKLSVYCILAYRW